MKGTFATNAKRDLRGIGLYIAQDNVPRSITFVEEVQERCFALAQHPERFPEVHSLAGVSVRKMSHGSYLVFYAVGQSTVEILRVVHSARDWRELIERQGRKRSGCRIVVGSRHARH